ncbi:hypothetical protein COU37_05210 [Candidatus Micrarchaeota archaeon CG10_big_fil_rev_8_21_14_0_10_45_29]|nr:MAG: hypothetical protein COU37_05210 [Candidatus Micrarchaeota archaeon CG10_big_fil_rev_8_21_14_0_10_45_29]
MKMLKIFCILLFAGAFFAIADVGIYIEPNIEYQTVELALDGANSTLLVIEGKETILINEGTSVKEESEIFEVLTQNIRYDSGYDKVLEDTDALLLQMRYDEENSRKECYKMTGMDRYPCEDKDTCVLSAFSTPISSTSVQADGFWEAMLEYRQNIEKISKASDELEALLQKAKPNNDSAKAIEFKIREIIDLEEKMAQNPLLLAQGDAGCEAGGGKTCFNFCPTLRWNLHSSSMNTLKGKWFLISTALADSSYIEYRAEVIANNTKWWLNYLNNKDSMWKEAKANLEKKKNELSANILQYGKKVNASAVEGEYSQYLLAMNATIAQADEGKIYYALKSADSLFENAQKMQERMRENEKKLQKIEDSLELMKTLFAALERGGENVTRMQSQYMNLKFEAEYPVQEEKISKLEEDATSLENVGLVMLAKTMLKEEDVGEGEAKYSLAPDYAMLAAAGGIGALLGALLSSIFWIIAKRKK